MAKPRKPLIRSDVYFLVALAIYLFGLCVGLFTQDFSKLDKALPWFAAFLLIGVLIKYIPSRLQKWFNADFLKKEQVVMPVDHPFIGYYFKKRSEFPARGVNGVPYFAEELGQAFIWMDHNNAYLPLVYAGATNELVQASGGGDFPSNVQARDPGSQGHPPPMGDLGGPVQTQGGNQILRTGTPDGT